MVDELKKGIDALKNNVSESKPEKKQFKNAKDLARSLMTDQEAINDIEKHDKNQGVVEQKVDKFGNFVFDKK